MTDERVIVLSYAHRWQEPGRESGTVFQRWHEAEWSVAFTNAVYDILLPRLPPGYVVTLYQKPRASGKRTALGLGIDEINRIPNVALACEFHLNDGPGNRSDYGLILANQTRLAKKISEALVFPLSDFRRDNGWGRVVHQWGEKELGRQIGWLRFIQAPALITEVGFLDFPGFAEWVFRPESIRVLARLHVDAILQGIR